MCIEYKRISDHDFSIMIRGCKELIGSPFEELSKITNPLPNKISVLVSGGIDGEFMVRWLLNRGKDVTPVFYALLYHDQQINQHDESWLSELPCDVRYESINLNEFYESEWFWSFVATYKCTSPQMALQAYMTELESKKAFTILTAIHPEPKCFNDDVWIQEREKDYSIIEYFKDNTNCLISPLRASPEMIASLLASDEFRNFKSFGLSDGRSRKHLQYAEWFGIEMSKRPKYHGFEGSEVLDNGMRQRIFDKHQYSECHQYINVKTMLSNLIYGNDIVYSSDKEIRVLYKECHYIGPAQ